MVERNDWSRNLASMLGKEVKTTLSTHPEIVIASGTLLSFTDDGEVVIRDEGGIIHWCWPNLNTELA